MISKKNLAAIVTATGHCVRRARYGLRVGKTAVGVKSADAARAGVVDAQTAARIEAAGNNPAIFTGSVAATSDVADEASGGIGFNELRGHAAEHDATIMRNRGEGCFQLAALFIGANGKLKLKRRRREGSGVERRENGISCNGAARSRVT